MAGGDRKIPVTINHGFVGGFDYARFINRASALEDAVLQTK